MKVAVLVPTLGRPHALAPLVKNIRETTPVGTYCIYLIMDVEDEESHRAYEDCYDCRGDLRGVSSNGTYPDKTNRGLAATEGEELILPTADDVVFHDGWYEAALKHFEAGADVVGTNDLTPATRDGKLATMPIVRRSYIEDPGAAWGEKGTVFNGSLHHNFVDRVLWELALHRGVAVFEPESVIEHRHHGWQTREVDDTDRKGNMQNWDADKALYKQMKAEWLAS